MKTLEEHVDGLNAINQEMVKHINYVIPQLKEYLNKIIFRADGKHRKDYSVEMIEMPQYGSAYIEYSNYSIWLKVSIWHNESSLQKSVYIGAMNNGAIVEVREAKDVIEDWKLGNLIDAKEEQEKISTLKVFEAKAEEVRQTILVEKTAYSYL